MSDAEKLKEILNSKNMTVKDLSKRCGTPPTTIYTIIQRDKKIRFELAIKIANVLDIEVEEICSSAKDYNTPLNYRYIDSEVAEIEKHIAAAEEHITELKKELIKVKTLCSQK